LKRTNREMTKSAFSKIPGKDSVICIVGNAYATHTNIQSLHKIRRYAYVRHRVTKPNFQCFFVL